MNLGLKRLRSKVAAKEGTEDITGAATCFVGASAVVLWGRVNGPLGKLGMLGTNTNTDTHLRDQYKPPTSFTLLL